MAFPNPKALGYGLKQWRTWRRKNEHDVHANVKANVKRIDTIRTWERNGYKGGYEALIQVVLSGYEVDERNTDLLVDFCSEPRLDQVAVIKTEEFRESPTGTGIWSRCVDRALLGRNRTLIEWFQFEPFVGSRWDRHEGHEYVLCLEGHVEVILSEKEKPTQSELRVLSLKRGEAVAFPSTLYHQVCNRSPNVAELVVAKPTGSVFRAVGSVRFGSRDPDTITYPIF